MICECAPENLQKTAGIFNAKITTNISKLEMSVLLTGSWTIPRM